MAFDGHDREAECPGDFGGVEAVRVAEEVDFTATGGHRADDGVDRRSELAHNRAVRAGVVDGGPYGTMRTWLSESARAHNMLAASTEQI